ncbi:MAG: hypothetical protein AUJ21_02020 [Anaerolineae bacterium CG1_02_58_13]|nr:MAG: hypothetical protein AUJ21_02020 [Anaerolineae bacterium CG1_02_58_13]
MENNSQTKPSLVMAIALMTLVNGIFNLIWGVSLIGGTFGLSLLCFPVPLFPIILGGFEIAYAIKLLDNPPQPVQPSQTIAILEIVAVLVGNVFSMVVGILALIFYNDSAVKDYFARLNGMQTPPRAYPAPVLPPPAESTPEPSAPASPVEPDAPKRRPRKVA